MPCEVIQMSKIIDEIPMEQIISRQVKLWERTYEKGTIDSEKVSKLCLTISKEMGSQGVEFAQGLSKRLKWKLYDKELVDYIAEHANVRKNMVESFDEKTQNEIHNWVLTLVNHHALGSDKYFKHLVTVITAIGESGCSIILGRGANFILPAHKTLRLRIVAPLARRIENLMHLKAVSKKQALEMLCQADKARTAFIQRFFHHESEEPSNYDLVLNLASLGFEVAEEIVIHTLHVKFPGVEISESE